MFRNSFPINYSEPLFRPPSEADSLILQITHGCTWNKCSFCEMYTTKQFRVKKEEDVFKEIDGVAELIPGIRKVFLADGNPMVLSSDKLKRILDKINQSLPKVRRVTTYALPRDIISKTPQELKMLRESGLTMIYVGIESGDDDVLKYMDKGETYNSTVEGLLKAKEAGIKLSVIILEGVGGLKFSEQHAVNSAKILNDIQPEFASVLVLSFPYGTDHYKEKFKGEYIPMTIPDLLNEMQVFISNIELENTIFRSNHASNYLVLNGILNRDKQIFLDKIEFAIKNPNLAGLRQEWQRGL